MLSKRPLSLSGCCTLVLVSLLPSVAAAQTQDYDLVVYGGTSAGVASAVQASRMGLRVALIEPTQHLGGMSSNGLSYTDIGNANAVGGIASDFYRRAGRAYGHTTSEYNFEPHVAESIFDSLAAETNVTVYRGQSLLRTPAGISKTGTRINSIVMKSGLEFAGKTFIDASYEGDLMARGGVSWTSGREANSVYGETYNGVQKAISTNHQFTVNVSPYVVAGDPASGVLPGINSNIPGPDGSGDNTVQAYNYRLTLTNVAANKRAWTRPAGYDASRYTLLSRYIAAGNINNLGSVLKISPIKNGKFDLNNQGAVSTDHIGANYSYPDASDAERVEIVAGTRAYQHGMLYFLATDSSVPATLRNQMNSYGLTLDDFTDNGGFSDQMYVREARRMLGQSVMSDKEILGQRAVTDPIALGAYTMDSHNTQRYVDASGYVRNEGNVQVPVTTPYAISLGSILPKESEASNLIVPAAMSSSHIAYGSIRMEPVFMELGQAAGVLAANAVRANASVQSLSYDQIESQLKLSGAITRWNPGAPVPRFVGTVSDSFDYGAGHNRVDVVSHRNGGWSQAWGPGFDTAVNATNLDRAAAYDRAANLTYSAPGYVNSKTPGVLVSGGAMGGSDTGAGVLVGRGIAGGMIGTIWITALVEIDSLTEANRDALIWLDRTASGNSDNTGNAFIGLRSGGEIALRFGGNTNVFETSGASYAADVTHLLLARIDINSSGTADSIQFWIDPNLTNLGAANLAVGGLNIFGSSFDGVGISVGSGGGMLDTLRISNLPDGFLQVTTIPEPSTVALLGAGLMRCRRRAGSVTRPSTGTTS